MGTDLERPGCRALEGLETGRSGAAALGKTRGREARVRLEGQMRSELGPCKWRGSGNRRAGLGSDGLWEGEEGKETESGQGGGGDRQTQDKKRDFKQRRQLGKN